MTPRLRNGAEILVVTIFDHGASICIDNSKKNIALGPPLRVWSTKILRPQVIFMAIFELSRVDYPRNRLRFTNSTTFGKTYVHVLIFLSKMVLPESLLLLEYKRYGTTKGGIHCTKVMSTNDHLDFVLISPFCTLISPN